MCPATSGRSVVIKGDGPGFVQELAVGIKDNGALSSANLLGNRIGIDQAKAFATILKEHPALKSLCGSKGDETELDMSGKMDGAGDAIMLVPELIDNGALLVLYLTSNNLRADGGKALADGLKGNQVITELNISDNNLGNGGYDTSGIIVLAGVIPDMGAMSSFTFGDKEEVTMTTAMTEANFSGKFYSCEAQMVAAFLPKCT